MDKNAIKKYAIWARRELLERVSQKAMQYGITSDGENDPSLDSVNGKLLSDVEKKQRQALIKKVRQQGYEQAMEEAAYTWFNRFAALRFMEVNGYLPSHVRVFTDDDGNFKPQILSEAIHLELDGLNMDKVYELKNANKNEELFKYLLITQCNALSAILPGMFQKIADYTELLLPDNLLREGSVIERMVSKEEGIPESDWTDQVQIIGWLYQYYNTEPKDKVFADLKKNIKITKEKIPAATQLFTPDWIVHYMVENSLGRLWLEGHPNDDLKAEWKYYLDEAEQEPDVQAQLDEIRKEYAALKPEEIRCIDPCMGSGHILCVLFDTLVQIYEDYGYTAREAAGSIVEKNLWGLDIDERAAQLAYFAVMMKARQYDRRFFSRGIQPHVYSPKGYAEGQEFGALLTVEELEPIPREPEVFSMFDESYEEQINRWNFRSVLAQKYHVVCTNPPYMGASNMNAKLSDFIKVNYSRYKSDYFSAFFVRCSEMALPMGKLGFFSPYVWMFIQSYEKLRYFLYEYKTIETLIQFEYSAFEEATVPVCTFVFSNYHANKYGCYLRLTDFRGGMEVQRQKTLEAINDHDCGYYYEQRMDNFSKIPGVPVAYWVSDKIIYCFKTMPSLGENYKLLAGTSTGDNTSYQRNWYEVSVGAISRNLESRRWYPCNTGGGFHKYSLNCICIIDWENDGFRIRNHINSKGKIGSAVRNRTYFFKEGITWNKLSSANFGVRYVPAGYISDDTARMIIAETNDYLFCLLGFLCSGVCKYFLTILSPTMSFTNFELQCIPLAPNIESSEVKFLAESNHQLSIGDRDSFEVSWDFTRHPLVRPVSTVAEAYAAWETECTDRFNQLKANEEEMNRIFIDIYGLQDELTPEVEDKDVTVRKADLGRDIRSLISYAIGCMFGRYSLHKEGLIFAGGKMEDVYQYRSGKMDGGWRLDGTVSMGGKAGYYLEEDNYLVDPDNIIPICDDDYFDDDITGRFIEWVELVYGTETLEENLQFIADALGGKGTSREVIRAYFINGFYADHCKVYQKRPIYWLFDSGKRMDLSA